MNQITIKELISMNKKITEKAKSMTGEQLDNLANTEGLLVLFYEEPEFCDQLETLPKEEKDFIIDTIMNNVMQIYHDKLYPNNNNKSSFKSGDKISNTHKKDIKVIDEFKIGDKVIFIDKEAHEKAPYYFPEVGTIGIIVNIDRDSCYDVQWPKGSTSENDLWTYSAFRLKPVQNSKMTRDQFEQIIISTYKECLDADCRTCKYYELNAEPAVCRAKWITDEIIKAHRVIKGEK